MTRWLVVIALALAVPLWGPQSAVAQSQDVQAEETTESAAAANLHIRPLNVAVLDNAPGFSTAGRFGSRRGFDVDLALAVCDIIGARCALKPMEGGQLVPALEARNVDFAVASQVSAGLAADPVLASIPYLVLPMRVVLPERDNLPVPGVPFEGQMAALTGTPQAALAQTIYPGRVALYANSDELWIDLALGRLTGVFAPALAAQADFLATPIGDNFKALPLPVSAEDGKRDAVILMRARDRELVVAVNDALSTLIGGEDFMASIERYLDPTLVDVPLDLEDGDE
ncbi:MAG: transporter substrate-binding domain-containing protein [Pseudomonadota bacterium]